MLSSRPMRANHAPAVHDVVMPRLDAPDFGLVLEQPGRVLVCADRAGLAAAIHRRRRPGEALRLMPDAIRVRTEVCEVVAVYAEDPIGARTRLIGHAWARRGSARDQVTLLTAALKAQVPDKALAPDGRGHEPEQAA